MGFGEWLAWVVVLLLALYGCAHLIRRISLFVTRCPAAVRCYRLAVPPAGEAIEPLFRCLQAQAAWGEGEETLLLLPVEDGAALAMARRLAQGDSMVNPVTAQELMAFLEAKETE